MQVASFFHTLRVPFRGMPSLTWTKRGQSLLFLQIRAHVSFKHPHPRALRAGPAGSPNKMGAPLVRWRAGSESKKQPAYRAARAGTSLFVRPLACSLSWPSPATALHPGLRKNVMWSLLVGPARVPGKIHFDKFVCYIPQTLLPLHFSFCRTTLKNDTSGITASGNVLSAFRIVTNAPASRGNGSRPSTLR